MADQSASQRKQGKRTNLRWSMLTGVALGVVYAVALYFLLENESLSSFSNKWGLLVVLAYVLLVGVLFFVIGFRRGRATGFAEEGVVVIIGASLIQAPTVLILFGAFSWAFNLTYMDRYGVLFALFGIDIRAGGLGVAWLLAHTLFFQILAGNIDAAIGGGIGKRYSRQQPKSDETPQP